MRTLTYPARDGSAITGDVYLPDSGGAAPVVISAHGGAWKAGTRASYQYLGPYLAANGIALFAIDYRLVRGSENRYPAAVDDLRDAVRYVHDHADELHINPERIALMGDSAGGHLAALVGLTADVKINVVVGAYGVYDMATQWVHDLASRPNDNFVQGFLGVPLTEDRRRYFETSPLSYAMTRASSPAFLLAWGTEDDIVDPAQSELFREALKQAGFYVRTFVVTAPHYWLSEPLEEPGSFAGMFAPRLLRFLNDRL